MASDEGAPSAVGGYLRSRRWWAVGLLALGVDLVGLKFGARLLPVGIADGVPVGAPIWAYLPVLTATAATVSAHGPSRALDQCAARPVEMWNAVYAAALACLASGVAFGVFAAGYGPVLGLATARNVTAWTGLALLTARVVGPQWSWAPSVGAVFVLEWFGRDSDGVSSWWAFATTSTSDLRTWALVALLVAAGLCATATSPWHVKAATVHLSPRRRRRTVSASQAPGPGT